MRPNTQPFSLDDSPEIQTKALRVISVTLLLVTVAASPSMAQVPEQVRAAIDALFGLSLQVS